VGGVHTSLGGRMTKARMANTMPLDAPFYPEPPYHYRNAPRLVLIYEADPEAALDLLGVRANPAPERTGDRLGIGG
jgi:acetoacetate decarboxylase